ncbi:MAG: CDP-alcohol phosphatidyltransferase family protein, partial [Aestuariivirgaceae bacterium]
LVSDASETAQPIAITIHGTSAGEAIDLLEGKGPSPDQLKLIVRSPADLGVAFWKGLRKREVPYAVLVTAENLADIEWRMFMGTYKGATDFVTKHVWPRPAYQVTRMLAPTAVSPNMVTTVGALFMVISFWLFLSGYFLTGLAAAWMMTFLDTVDGKLARTTLTSSKWGDIFDHGIDLVHPPFWYAAWGYGAVAAGTGLDQSTLWLLLAVIIAGYVIQRLMEGIAIKWLGLEIHIWRPIDTFFRQITARRNPNLALLTVFAVVGRPDWGLISVAAWTALCLVLHGVQLIQAFAAKRTGEALESWMSAPVSPK